MYGSGYGISSGSTSEHFGGYIDELVVFEGQSLAPRSFSDYDIDDGEAATTEVLAFSGKSQLSELNLHDWEAFALTVNVVGVAFWHISCVARGLVIIGSSNTSICATSDLILSQPFPLKLTSQ